MIARHFYKLLTKNEVIIANIHIEIQIKQILCYITKTISAMLLKFFQIFQANLLLVGLLKQASSRKNV